MPIGREDIPSEGAAGIAGSWGVLTTDGALTDCDGGRGPCCALPEEIEPSASMSGKPQMIRAARALLRRLGTDLSVNARGTVNEEGATCDDPLPWLQSVEHFDHVA